ncbi:MAG: TrbC/VirB2 family protein [Clostridia bacterium]|nr:TrbC/VirB2 family protein [Clostridia bacterium]
MKKFMLRVMPIIMVLLVVVATPVFALDLNETFNNNNAGGSNTANRIINNVWGTVLLVLQILAVAAIVFAGVKYMFAGADEKATIKNGLLVLAIGAILVFGASTVVKLLMDVVSEV